MFFNRKLSKEEGKRALESLERAQKLLDERLEKNQIEMKAYQEQCKEFGRRREKIRKQVGEEVYQELTFQESNLNF